MTTSKAASTPLIRILKKSNCPKLSPKAKGSLTYHIGYAETAKTHLIRVTANTGGGFFSNEWVALGDILDTIDTAEFEDSFKAIILKPLYQSKGANNHGFLAAALRAEGILEAVEDHPLSHTLGDTKAFTKAMQKLVKEKVSLDDDVAEAEKIKEEKRAVLVAKMKKAAAEKVASKGKSKT
jgi:hypothetical protein